MCVYIDSSLKKKFERNFLNGLKNKNIAILKSLQSWIFKSRQLLLRRKRAIELLFKMSSIITMVNYRSVNDNLKYVGQC